MSTSTETTNTTASTVNAANSTAVSTTFQSTSLEQLKSHVDSYYKLFDAGSNAILKNSIVKSKFCGCIPFKTNVINIIVTFSNGAAVKLPVIEEYTKGGNSMFAKTPRIRTGYTCVVKRITTPQ